ncbi:MAG TPA: hypothetical protein VLT90_07015 [Terriglobales bacterium]|nr:hypothetical protein [Terriglobales bacterium]
MNTLSGMEFPSTHAPRPSMAPVLTLLFIAPFIGEVLSGATRVSYIFVFIPEIMVWGCGTLLIREAVRRWHGGWASMLPLALALSVAEEFIIQQTSLAPLPWLGSGPMYGRVWGVNWIYFLFMLGYESVWIVLVPIQVAELIFPGRRKEPWLRLRGLMISGLVFILGSAAAWFLWVKRARTVVFHVPEYSPPMITLLLGTLAIALLILAGYLLRSTGNCGADGSGAPSPWLVGLAALALGFPWFLLMGLVFVPRMSVPLWQPVIVALAWATIAILQVQKWIRRPEFRDVHRWAMAFGAIIVCSVAGFAGCNLWPRIDVFGKAILNGIAIALMALLLRQVRRRTVA